MTEAGSPTRPLALPPVPEAAHRAAVAITVETAARLAVAGPHIGAAYLEWAAGQLVAEGRGLSHEVVQPLLDLALRVRDAA